MTEEDQKVSQQLRKAALETLAMIQAGLRKRRSSSTHIGPESGRHYERR
jgi:hypothetical protein